MHIISVLKTTEFYHISRNLGIISHLGIIIYITFHETTLLKTSLYVDLR